MCAGVWRRVGGTELLTFHVQAMKRVRRRGEKKRRVVVMVEDMYNGEREREKDSCAVYNFGK